MKDRLTKHDNQADTKIKTMDSASVKRRHILQGAMAMLAVPLLTGSAPSLSQAVETARKTPGGEADLPILTQKRVLGSGKFSMEVSALGFGCMGATYNRGVSPDKAFMINIIRQAAEHGYTLFDTAEIYGPHNNELLVGEALEPYKGKVMITTKFGHKIINGVYQKGELDSKPATVRRVCEECLKRLRVDAIEMFYQHRMDPEVPIEDVAGTVRDLIKEGKVKRFGLCEVGVDTIRRAHKEQPITAVQSEYHMMWREPELDIFPVLEELGIGFVPYSPINRGFLGGSFTAYTRFDSGNDNRGDLPRFLPENLGKNLEFVEVINRFGRPHGLTTAQIALAWLMRRQWIVPIPGTTKLSHLEENIRAANVAISDSDWTKLENELSRVVVIGDRYNAAEQKQIQR